MAYAGYATRVTRVANGDGDVSLGDTAGDPVYVHSIVVANGSGSAVTQQFTESSQFGSTSNNVATIVAPANDTEDWNPLASFDKGFRIPEPASSVVVTVTWRPQG